jgi:glycerol-3-phosphate dehydrogenase
MERKTQLEKLKNEEFDLLIIGGGASGAGAALDAAGRGLRVALVEGGDFASATSSKSTKLIHGGVRYLEQAVKKLDLGQLKQVIHGLHERRTMLESAPFLAKPLELITPCSNFIESCYFFIGLKMYDWLAGRKNNLPPAQLLSKKTVLAKLPGIKRAGLHSAVAYFDGVFDDARYALLLALTAEERGATVANYLIINGFEKNADGKITAAHAEDRESGAHFLIKTKVVLNCTGAASDAVREMANSDLDSRLRPSKGAHILLPKSVMDSTGSALLIPETSDGRLVFAIPQAHGLMVGTTDTPVDDHFSEPHLDKKDRDFLIETLNRYLEKPISASAIRASFAGLRPLISAGKNRSTATLLRDHEVEFDEKSGLISLLGGKWTTWRLMASDAVDFACKQLNINVLCSTNGIKLRGTERQNVSNLAKYDLPADVLEHLFSSYGSHASDVCELAKGDFSKRILPDFPFIGAEVIYHIRVEMACSLRDILARRWRLEQTDFAATLAAMPKVAEIIANEIGWGSAEKTKAMTEYATFITEMGKI